MTTKAQARKNLKKAAKLYKETVRQPVTIEFQEEHLSVLIRALEVYQRLKLGQIDYALDEAFGHSLEYEKKQEIHKLARKYLFEGTDMADNPNCSWGIYNQEKVGDATLGYEVQKVLRRYKAFQRNDGWGGWGRDFDEPYSHTKIPLPVVKHFIDYKDFRIPKKLWKKIDDAHANKETADWRKIWEAVDKAMPNLPKGKKSELYDDSFSWYVRIYSAIKPEETI